MCPLYPDSAELDALFHSNARLIEPSTRIAPNIIHISRLKDANISEPSNAVVQSVQFHPGGRLVLTAGLDKGLRFFEVRDNAYSETSGSKESVKHHLPAHRFSLLERTFATVALHV